jgi:hypothetical protein
MAKEQVIVEDIVNSAIIEGFNSGLQMFLKGLDDDLKRDAVVQENGTAYDHFQAMINENITEPASNVQELQSRIKKVLS